MECPCHGCYPPKRHVACHDTCLERKDWVEDEETKKIYIRATKTGYVDPIEFEKRHKPINKR